MTNGEAQRGEVAAKPRVRGASRSRQANRLANITQPLSIFAQSLSNLETPLLRHLFALATVYPAQILSYNKMLGQLQDAGNVTTLAGYLRLQGQLRKQGSSPKLILWNNALINALSLPARREVVADGGHWGRLVENAVGAHLLCGLPSTDFDVTYWRDGAHEVDFVVTHGKHIWAIEVKSGQPGRLSGLAAGSSR